jgi:hypothetical protein
MAQLNKFQTDVNVVERQGELRTLTIPLYVCVFYWTVLWARLASSFSNKTHRDTLDLRSTYLPEGTYCATLQICPTYESSWNPKSSALAPDRPQRDSPATCVIAQQYSPTTLHSLRFYCRKEKYGALSTFNFF